MANALALPILRIDDANGAPISGAKAYFYVTGTTTPAEVYTTAERTTPHASPVVANSAGILAPIFLDPSITYKLVVTNAAGTPIDRWTVDPISDTSSLLETYIDAGNAIMVNLAAPPYNAVADSDDQTALVQEALDELPDGATLHLPPGVKFSLRDLTFPARGYLHYRIDDDTDTYFLTPDLGSGEEVMFSFNSSYPADPTGSAANETIFAASLHPGVIVDVRKDVEGHDAFFSPGQDRANPARASYLVRDQQSNAFGIHYEYYGDTWSNTSGIGFYTYRRIQTLKGVTSTDWPTPPSVNDRIRGAGGPADAPVAAGFFIGFDSVTDETVVEWITGRFLSGMTVTNTTANPDVIATATIDDDSDDDPDRNQPLSTAIRTGNWGIGIPPGLFQDLFSVGGDIGVTSTITFDQYVEKEVTYPGYTWRLDLNSPSVGCSIRQAASESEARLWVYDDPDESDGIARGMVGAVCASCRFDDSLATSPAWINVTGVTNPATGQYKVDFRRDVANAAYQVQVSMTSGMARASASTFYNVAYEFTEVDDLFVYVYLVDLAANTVTAADIPASNTVSVTIFGADIPTS